MSSLYHTEPATRGKVILHTSMGAIDIELWSKEAPLACRNFVQLALEGRYDRTIFHRVVKGFMVQGGDPTGTGSGGDSIWEKPFRDETNPRLRFNHRGQVAMANENRRDTNRAQFFMTLDECRWLDHKHTIFGTVAGNTVFNLLRIGEVELDGERPLEDVLLKTVEVLDNPFDDLVPRPFLPPQEKIIETTNKDKPKTVSKPLLSFADEEDEEVIREPMQRRSNDEVKRKIEPMQSLVAYAGSDSEEEDEEEEEEEAHPPKGERTLRESVKSVRKEEKLDLAADAQDFHARMRAKIRERAAKSHHKPEDDEARKQKLDVIAAEAKKARAELRIAKTANIADAPKNKKLKKSLKDREEDTLKRLAAFKTTLFSKKKKNTADLSHDETQSYHGQILRNGLGDDDEDDPGNDDDWFVGKLKFKKHTDELFQTGGDGRATDDYVTIDTRSGATFVYDESNHAQPPGSHQNNNRKNK